MGRGRAEAEEEEVREEEGPREKDGRTGAPPPKEVAEKPDGEGAEDVSDD